MRRVAQNRRKVRNKADIAIYTQDMQRQASGYGYESAPRRRSIDIPLEGDTYGGNVRSSARRSNIDVPLGSDKRMSSTQVGVSRSRIDIPIGSEPQRQRIVPRAPSNTQTAQRTVKRAASAQTEVKQQPLKKKSAKKRTQTVAAPRRISRSEARRRRKRLALIQAGIFLTAIAIGLILSVTVLFPIQSYRIDGDTVYSQEEIIMAFGHAEGENIFRFNIKDSEEDVLQSLPYIESLRIRRRLPGTVVFIAEPAVETYCVQVGGQTLVLSAGFKILRIADAPPEGLCIILGTGHSAITTPGNLFVQTSEEQQKLLQTVTAEVETWFPEGITYIDISNPYEITIIYETRYLIKLGTVNSLSYKLEMAAATINDKLGPYEAGVLDASYTGKVFYAAGAAPTIQDLPAAAGQVEWFEDEAGISEGNDVEIQLES